MVETRDELRQRIEMLEARISNLYAAVLRVSASLDLETVLREIVDSARTLTGARYGMIETVDTAGQPQDFVSAGFTPEEERELAAWPDRVRLFEHLRGLPGPLRLTDLSGYIRSLGLTPARTFSRTFQGTPMRHRGEDVGHFFLAGKADGEAFTDDDDEVLMLFASQAATAVTNARTHRNEQRARSMVSHELQAPLTSIIGSTTTLLRSAERLDPAEMRGFFRIIDEQAEQMRGLIADLLDQGRIETGTLSVTFETAEVAGLVEQARRTFLSSGGKHALRIDLPDDLPWVMADRARIVQVLNNLFSNASRHAPESSPIRVAAERDGVHVAISVSDEGRGVPPDRLPHLFSQHPGAAGGVGPRARGYGLGLAICKGLVEAHGGRIWAESGGAGRGTRFTFTVPVAGDAGDAGLDPRRKRPTSARQGTEQTCILVVDDDPQTLRYVRDALVEAGYAPVATGDPEQLPELIRTHKPRLVLLDLVLPGADGLALMQDMRELEDLPVIFISAYDRDETIVRALDAGADDYIVKPFSPLELTARVRAALRRHAGPEAFRLGELAIHYEERRVTVGGRPVALTVTEFEVLRVLSRKAGRAVTYDALLRHAWGARRRSSGNEKHVRAIVKSLRRKLGDDAGSPTYVHNERGVGYRMPGPGDV